MATAKDELASRRRTRASSRGGAARAELNGKLRTITVHGVELELPSKVPFRAMKFIGGDGSASDVVGFLSVVLGDEQMEKVWDIELDARGDQLAEQLNEVMNELLDEVTGALGLTPGE